jgi:galactofuranose transport system substrate-binding protein
MKSRRVYSYWSMTMKNTFAWTFCAAAVTCCIILPSCGKKTEETTVKKIIVGFSQVGAESDWRSANTLSIKGEAKARGVDLRFADAQQQQENQIKALRSFIAQKADIIAFAPVVTTGWQGVLEEIKAAGIPVILTDRAVDVTDKSLYVTLISPDTVEEGRRAARWFIENTKGELRVFELLGTPGSSPAIDRKKGFKEAIADHPRIKIIKSQDGDFQQAKGKMVTEAFLKTPEGKTFNALYAHNDNMAIGAIQAIKEAGLKPGEEIKIVSIDAVRAAFEAMVAGELNCTVECNPLLGPKLFDVIETVLTAKKLTLLDVFQNGLPANIHAHATKHKFLKPNPLDTPGEGILKKRVLIDEGVFDQSVAKELIGGRKY